MAPLQASKIADLTGRVALVTGGGTGNIIARGLAANGAEVYITGRRKEVLDKAAAKGSSIGLNFVPLALDITDQNSIGPAAQFIKDKEAKLHILVNNAGRTGPIATFAINPSAPERKDTETLGRSFFESQTFAEWNETYQTNVAPIFFVTYAFLGLLEAGAHGLGVDGTSSVINISSSMGSTHMIVGMHCYVATKAALNHLSLSMATDFALQKIPIRVNVVAPGYFLSEMASPDLEQIVTSGQVMPGTRSGFPTKRHGRDEEMTMTVLSLVTSGYTNGQIIALDGGYSLVNP